MVQWEFEDIKGFPHRGAGSGAHFWEEGKQFRGASPSEGACRWSI